MTGENEFGDLFFETIDEIDDYIVEGKDLNFILKEFNLDSAEEVTLDKHGNNKIGKAIINFPIELVKNIFEKNDSEYTILTINNNKYYVFEILKTEKIQKKINDVNIKENILENLKINSKRKYITEIINKINNNNFNKLEFDNLLKEENATSKKVSIESLNDDKQLSENLVQQIYTYPEKKVILVADMGLSEVYLVYIDKVENVTISRESEDYKKYLKLSQAKMITDLYAAYDMFLRKKYEVEINYSALDNLKNNIK